jgi:hypothetical protein
VVDKQRINPGRHPTPRRRQISVEYRIHAAV